jgi:hypothetical protein
MSFYKKYLKYKNKYLSLKNQFGSGEITAKNHFIKNMNTNILAICKNDRILTFDKTKPVYTEADYNEIFDEIYKSLNKDNKNIDWIIKSYMNNTFGSPSSVENYGRFLDAFEKYTLLKKNYKDTTLINEINGLLELEEFISSGESKTRLLEIDEKHRKKAGKKMVEKSKKELGHDDVEIILETDKVMVYRPTTEAGAKYYGRNTKWCTASDSNNMFNHYNSEGPLYIIQSKTDDMDKYQIHIESEQIMNDKDEPISIEYLENHFSDKELNVWIHVETQSYLFIDDYKYKYKYYMSDYKDYDGNFDILLQGLPSLQTLQTLEFGKDFNQPLGTSLQGLTSLQTLKLGKYFNQPLGTSLQGLTSLQTLEFGDEFNQLLGTSLQGLTSLQTLNFGKDFNQPLGTSLQGLTSLQTLNFGKDFNQPLGTSLQGLTSLHTLDLYNFNKDLGTSLQGLSSLKMLKLNTFNQPLGTSLQGLSSLHTLELDNFNQPLGTSLQGLSSLHTLELDNFNQPLNTSLQGLRSLYTLHP